MIDLRPLRTTITKPGQPYVDQPTIAQPKALVNAVRAALGIRPLQPEQCGWTRQAIDWVKPPKAAT